MPNRVTDVPRGPLSVLLVEDDPGDVVIAQEALRASKLQSRLNVVSDGNAAMAYLRRQNGYADAQRPDLILLDLNLPKKNGSEVLAELKSDPELARIPVIVLTSSTAEVDIHRSYDLHANAYVTKPVAFDGFFAALRQIQGFWLDVVKLPADPNPKTDRT